MKIFCPRCGSRNTPSFADSEDEKSYVITCQDCKTRIFLPKHPMMDYGIDFLKSTKSYFGKLKEVHQLIQFLVKKGTGNDKK